MRKVSIPTVISDIPRDLRNFVDRVREVLTSSEFNAAMNGETKRKDSAVGAGPLSGNGVTGDGTVGDTFDPNAVTPPPPQNVKVKAGFSVILVSWDTPHYAGHDHAEVWGVASPITLDEMTSPPLTSAVMLGTSSDPMYAHNVIVYAGLRVCFWVRFVNVNGVAGPFNSSLGTCAETVTPAAFFIKLLSDEIKESDIYIELGSEITSIRDGIDLLTKSVTDELLAEIGAARASIVSIENVSETSNSAIAKTLSGLVARVNDPATGLVATQATIADLREVTADATTAKVLDISALTARVGEAEGTITDIREVITGPDGVVARSIEDLKAMVGTSEATVTDMSVARISYCTKNNKVTEDDTKEECEAAGGTWVTNQPFSKAVKQLTIDYVDASGVTQNGTLEEAMKVYVTPAGTPAAMYTLKTDVNGLIAGFGLSNDGETSLFGIRADCFWLAPPGYNTPLAGPPDDMFPFIVRTTDMVINGRTVPKGTYIKDAYIDYAQITTAVAGTLTADDGTFLKTIKGGIATSFTEGVGFFSGQKELGGYGFRVGDPAGGRIQWTFFGGIEIYNDSNQLLLSSGGGIPSAGTTTGGTTSVADTIDWSKISNRPTNLATLNAALGGTSIVEGGGDGSTIINNITNPPVTWATISGKPISIDDWIDTIGVDFTAGSGTTIAGLTYDQLKSYMGTAENIKSLGLLTALSGLSNEDKAKFTYISAAAIGLLLTDTIIAGHIAADSISTNQLMAGAITTDKVASHAISNVYFAHGSGSSPEIQISNNPGKLVVIATANFLSTGPDSTVSMSVKIGGSVQTNSTVGVSSTNGSSVTATTMYSLDVGDNSFSVGFDADYGSMNIGKCSVMAMVLKR